MVGWMRGTFEFDQPFKRTESKTPKQAGKISSRKINLCEFGNAQTIYPE